MSNTITNQLIVAAVAAIAHPDSKKAWAQWLLTEARTLQPRSSDPYGKSERARKAQIKRNGGKR